MNVVLYSSTTVQSSTSSVQYSIYSNYSFVNKLDQINESGCSVGSNMTKKLRFRRNILNKEVSSTKYGSNFLVNRLVQTSNSLPNLLMGNLKYECKAFSYRQIIVSQCSLFRKCALRVPV